MPLVQPGMVSRPYNGGEHTMPPASFPQAYQLLPDEERARHRVVSFAAAVTVTGWPPRRD
jgi:hypothetical protein